MNADLCELGFLAAADALAKGETTSAELTAALLARAEKLEPALNALTWRDAEAAQTAAKAADAARAAG
ncbi:MAG TPA: amidase, partial [Kiritimatiellia bacterium]|nr:amidase [Kiritimatiellia bacterium]